MKRVLSSSAPASSTMKVVSSTQRISRTSPLRRLSFMASCITSRSRSVMRRPIIMNTSEVTVIKPSPPACISISSTHWPKSEKVCPTSTTLSPVTHTADVAVNSAS